MEPKNSSKKGWLIGCGCGCGCLTLIAIVIVIFVLFAAYTDEGEPVFQHNEISINDKRESYTQFEGNKAETTLMIYMIGSDLETDDGSASNDLEEILAADTSGINITLQTGGTKKWHNPYIKSGVTQRHLIKDGKISLMEDMGNTSMVEPDTLSDFIKWSAKCYPADRYMLVLWNHGGGSALGFGVDEYHEDEMLELSEIGKALNESDVKFDIVGFDACLMGTLETAYMLEPYADYLIASEEVEPGTGWYYTNWVNKLSSDTVIDSVELGKVIIDDYISGPDSGFWDSNTLSVIDLTEIPYTYQVLSDYMNNSAQNINELYSSISNARSNAKDFGDGGFEQIDILSYITRLDGIEGQQEVIDAVSSAVKYSNSSTYGANGLAMYYPYDVPEYYEEITNDMELYGFDDYEPFFDSFLTIMTGGQVAASNSTNENYSSSAAEDFLENLHNASWYNTEESEEYFNDDFELSDYGELEIFEKGDYYALSMSDEDWENITDIGLQVLVDDGEGYIDLGEDSVYSFDDDGDLIVEFDNTWVALNGHTVPFYTEYYVSDGNKYTNYGYVPATLNGEEEIEIMIYWDSENPDGYVTGYRLAQAENTLTAPRKGLKQFNDGDVIDFSCDYYTYDGEHNGVYSFGDPITYSGDLEVSYEDIGENSTLIYYNLTDIYNNIYTTETVSYE
ncbi:MAG: clostripain [Firmicutes bacterium]|nr:clostripain [Bacillota bacterium]